MSVISQQFSQITYIQDQFSAQREVSFKSSLNFARWKGRLMSAHNYLHENKLLLIVNKNQYEWCKQLHFLAGCREQTHITQQPLISLHIQWSILYRTNSVWGFPVFGLMKCLGRILWLFVYSGTYVNKAAVSLDSTWGIRVSLKSNRYANYLPTCLLGR